MIESREREKEGEMPRMIEKRGGRKGRRSSQRDDDG